jgi:glycosyltransferase involved in cell wall biosynthesis
LNRPRLALLPDFPEEGWPSMDLCAEMLQAELERGHADRLQVQRLVPPFRRRFSRLPGLAGSRTAFNADRLLNRMWDFRRHVRGRRHHFDCFHLCDHSYAHLVHELPAERTGVYCHDLDMFRCLLQPRREWRPRWFRAMARSILRGLEKAAMVFFNSHHVRRQLEEHQVVGGDRLVHAPLGVAPEFSNRYRADDEATAESPSRFLLHVGSCVPRKRIDVLLAVFAELRTRWPDLRLVKVGGDWAPEHRRLMKDNGLGAAVVHRTGLTRAELARLYRQATAVLVPSDAEGFGLPVIEALACGATVLASDLPSLREAGGNAAVYLPVGDVPEWTRCLHELLCGTASLPPVEARLAQAGRFTWSAHARIIADTYLERCRPAAQPAGTAGPKLV